MKYKIETPVRTYNGLSAGVPFIQGVGYTDSEERMKWFKSKGYKVTNQEEAIKEIMKDEESEILEEVLETENQIEEEDLEEEVEEVEKPKTTNTKRVKKIKK